jgi:hypothetical protein
VLKKHLKGENCLPVIKRIRAGQPEGLKEFSILQKDTKTDELMKEDLGKLITMILNNTRKLIRLI